MDTEYRAVRRRIIETDAQADPTPADRQTIRMPYQADSVLFAGWGVKL